MKDRIPYIEQACGHDTPCWIWQGVLSHNGYGRRWNGSRYERAHRYYYEQAKGLIPDGEQVDHLCKNPSCVNPEHLEAVSPAENTRRSNTAKIALSDARAIRAARKEGVSLNALARQYGITKQAVSYVSNGRTWREA